MELESKAQIEGLRADRTVGLDGIRSEIAMMRTRTVAEVLSGRTEHGLMPPRPEPAAIRLHGDLAEAIQAGDAVAAQRAMTEIITEAAGALPSDVPQTPYTGERDPGRDR